MYEHIKYVYMKNIIEDTYKWAWFMKHSVGGEGRRQQQQQAQDHHQGGG